MSAPAFKATFSDFKNVKTRKVLQLIFEVPAEAADAAMAVLGGVPMADREIWVGIARIDLTKAASAPAKPSDAPPKERRRFNALSGAQQSGMRCEEPTFRRFMAQRNGVAFDAMSPEYAADLVRDACGVESRKEIVHGTPAGDKWRKLDDAYQAWLHVDA